MKNLATLIVAIAMAASVSVANAADNLWYTLISTSDASIVAGSSGPGQTLSLLKPNAGPATVRIGVNISNQYDFFAGWTLNLQTTAGSTFANGVRLGTYDQDIDGIVNGSMSASFGAGSSSLQGSEGLIYEFDLVLTGSNLPVAVTGDFGAQGIIYSNNFNWYGFVGANPISYGKPNYTFGPDTTPGWGSLPVITVAVPEPTTLVLLGLGTVALLRRRK